MVNAKLPIVASLGSNATASASPPAPMLIRCCPALLSLEDFWNNPSILAPPLRTNPPPINKGRNCPIPLPKEPPIFLGSGRLKALSSAILSVCAVSSTPLATPIGIYLPKSIRLFTKPELLSSSKLLESVSWNSCTSCCSAFSIISDSNLLESSYLSLSERFLPYCFSRSASNSMSLFI